MNDREKFEKWMEKDGIELATLSEKCAAFKGWQAALSTRKAYGYGIVDKDGKPEGDGDTDKEVIERITEFLNELFEDDAPHRVVELFYEDSES